MVTVSINVITPEDNASATAEKYGVENQNGVTPPLFVQQEGRFMPCRKIYTLAWCLKGIVANKPFPSSTRVPVEYEIMRTIPG